MGETNTAATGTKPGEPSAASSDGKTGSTSAPAAFTQADVEKAVSDALAKAGRTEKALKDREAALTPREQAIKDAETRRQQEAEAQEEAALEDVTKDKPEEKLTLQSYKAKLRQEKADFAALKAKHSPVLAALEELGITDAASLRETVTAARTTRLEMDISAAATKAGVSAELLRAKAAKLGVTTAEGLEELAGVMDTKAASEKHDSGANAGGEDISKLSARELIQRGLSKK